VTSTLGTLCYKLDQIGPLVASKIPLFALLFFMRHAFIAICLGKKIIHLSSNAILGINTIHGFI